MSDDLVKQAREMAKYQEGYAPYDCCDDSDLLNELAERLEELEAKLEELLVVSKRAVRLSLDHADFKLYAMEPMHQAIAAAELKG